MLPLLASAGMGLLGGKALVNAQTPNLPNRETAQLDSDTQEVMKQQQARASQNLSQTANELTQGAEGARGVLPQEQQFQQQATALGMAQPEDLSKALSNRANRYFEGDMIKLQNQAKLKAGNLMAQRQQAAMGSLEAQQKIRMQAYDNALATEKAKQQARSAALGNILGLVGMGVGAAAGGASGAKAGQKMQGLGSLGEPTPMAGESYGMGAGSVA